MRFLNPFDPRIAGYERRTAGAMNSPQVLHHFANVEYVGIEVEDRLGLVTQPDLVLTGRGDRTRIVAGAEATAKGLPHAEMVVFENSGHMTYVEENEKYLAVVRKFLNENK